MPINVMQDIVAANTHSLPLVLAGPILRAVHREQVTFWLATRAAVDIKLTLWVNDAPDSSMSAPEHTATSTDTAQPHNSTLGWHFTTTQMAGYCHTVRCAEQLYLQLIHIPLANDNLPEEVWINYDLRLKPQDNTTDWQGWQAWAPDLVYPGKDAPGFVIKSKLQRLLHGSCRKPHFPCRDGLVTADDFLAKQTDLKQWPALLMLSGDQVYADDVAAPLLRAVHQLIAQLGFNDERLPCSAVSQAVDLHHATPYYFKRDQLLPKTADGKAVLKQVFKGVKKPIFTSDSARNHLISLAEMLGMYLLVWSPAGWLQDAGELTPEQLAEFTPDDAARYREQQLIIADFAKGLPQVRRVLAHLPTAMIFDDHDVTDDWNLTAEWEQTAYNHDFSKRIIGNALIAYLLCQAWGNTPDRFEKTLLQRAEHAFTDSGSTHHQHLIDSLLRYEQWHYQWPTDPPLLVLDTRTRRWRSEVSLGRPSGLLDWEAITELQQDLLGHNAVVLVASAPVFGVKLIENIQKVFTFFGKPLLVDAENWMAHPGTANALLNIFRHPKTPKHFVILSGDVHYSFVYEVNLRGKRESPAIWQITSSGLKNQFPPRLLDVLDRLNRWLYAPRSPLNWLTTRRRMKIVPHKPDHASSGERLLNAAGIGLVDLNPDGSPKRVAQLTVNGDVVCFTLAADEARWE